MLDVIQLKTFYYQGRNDLLNAAETLEEESPTISVLRRRSRSSNKKFLPGVSIKHLIVKHFYLGHL